MVADIYKLPKNTLPKVREVFEVAGVTYSHTEQRGMLKAEYIWKHHPSLKSCKTIVWVSSIDNLRKLCQNWGNSNWTYLPLTF